jgi:hypothetical protein
MYAGINMSFEVTIDGMAPLLAALEQWPELARPELEKAASAALLSLIGPLADYPPAPGGSTYRRTGALGRLWTSAQPEFSAESSGFEASLTNATPYGPYVQGEWQAKQHQGRWQTAEQVVTAHEADIEAYFEAALTRVTERLGG